MKNRHVLVVFVTFLLAIPLQGVAQDFTGTWMGNSAGSSFQLQIWTVNREWNALMKTDNIHEVLTPLGYDKEENILYFFRPATKTCLTIYADKGLTFMGILKKDTTASVMLMRI
jgi:hypothetical protein